MIIPSWLVYILKHTPGVKVLESWPLKSSELESMVDRIMLEKENQWKFNHFNEPYPGITMEEVVKELKDRLRVE